MECVRPDCKFHHPRPVALTPRKVHAQVVVIRRDAAGKFWVLLQRRGLHKKMAGGRLSSVGGRCEAWEDNSRQTAIREVYEETGLQDVGFLEGAPETARKAAATSTAQPPLSFQLFAKGKNVDWWVLLIDGEGAFGASPSSSHQSEEISPVLDALQVGVLAPAFGHAWFPAMDAAKLPRQIVMTGLCFRIRQALFFVMEQEREALAPPSSRPDR